MSSLTGKASGRWPGWLPDAAAVAALALAATIFFWPVVTGQAWLPRGGGDSVSFLYPNYRFAADQLRHGVIPFWNPHQYAGAPFLADNQSGIFYPFNLLLFLLWPGFSYRGIELLVIWHFFFAGCGMYALLRLLTPRQPIAPGPALVGALAFMFSDLFITHVGNLNLNAVASWLPLAFLGLHRSVLARGREARLLWAVGGGLALGLGTLAGHGQMTFLLAAFLGVYGLHQAIVRRVWWPMAAVVVLGLVAVGISAISLLPSFGTLSSTLRAEFSAEQATNYSLPPQAWPGLVAPDFFGRGAEAFWGGWPRVEVGYLGVLPWVLAAAALWLRRNRLTIFFAGAGLLFLLLALGPATPLYPLLLRSLPVVPFQVPARFVLLLDFCVAALAAIGLDGLLMRRPDRRRLMSFLLVAAASGGVIIALLLRERAELGLLQPDRLSQMGRAVAVFSGLATASLLVAFAAARSRLPRPAVAGAAALLLFLDLYSLGRYVEIDWNDPTPGFAEGSAALDFLRSDPGIHRIDIATGAWQPNMPQLQGLYAARGVYNPLQLANYTVYIGAVGYRGSAPYNVLGVKYLIGGKGDPPGDTTFIIPVFDQDPAVTVYLNTRALPRAIVYHQARVVADHDAAFEATHNAAFDPTQTLILESGRPLSQPPGQSTIEIIRYDLNDVAFSVTTDRPAYFFLSDVAHPDWRATVNGQAVPILTAHYAFRAVFLEPGTSLVEMRFLPTGWVMGVTLSLMTAIVIIGLVAGYGRRVYHLSRWGRR